MKDMARWLYSALMTMGQPMLRRKLKRRGQQEPGYLEAVEERFGYYHQTSEKRSELIWIHAVSLGETRTAAILLKALRAQYPALRLLLTHGTATGHEEGRALLKAIGQPGDIQAWQPWDSPASVNRFLDHFKPCLGLLMETEIWPNLVAEAKQRHIPLVLINGRLSPKSLKQAQNLASLSFPAYGALSAVYAQTQADADRFLQLGAPVAKVLGNLKFDATPDAAQWAQGQAWRQALEQPLLMFASSREGEEDGFIKQIVSIALLNRSYNAINSIANPIKLFKTLIVPRHPQRFEEVAALITHYGLRVSLRSQWAGNPAESLDAMNADFWLGDSVGEMAMYYGMSDVALLGGSFAPLGGQNLIEAAACGCPIVMGPHTFNFTEAAALAEASGAAQRTENMAQAVRVALDLIDEPKALSAAAKAGLAFAARHRGATAHTLDSLQAYLRHI